MKSTIEDENFKGKIHDEDRQKERISAKNGLESYCFNMKSTIEDENFKGKIHDEDRSAIKEKCEEAIRWLDGNQTAEKEEYTDKLAEVEVVCKPIVTKLYGSAGANMPGGAGMPSGGSGPTVEEVD